MDNQPKTAAQVKEAVATKTSKEAIESGKVKVPDPTPAVTPKTPKVSGATKAVPTVSPERLKAMEEAAEKARAANRAQDAARASAPPKAPKSPVAPPPPKAPVASATPTPPPKTGPTLKPNGDAPPLERTRERLIEQLSTRQANIFDIVGSKPGQAISADEIKSLRNQGSRWLHPDLPSNKDLDPGLQAQLNKIIDFASNEKAMIEYQKGLKKGYSHDDLMEAWKGGDQFSPRVLKRRRPEIPIPKKPENPSGSTPRPQTTAKPQAASTATAAKPKATTEAPTKPLSPRASMAEDLKGFKAPSESSKKLIERIQESILKYEQVPITEVNSRINRAAGISDLRHDLYDEIGNQIPDSLRAKMDATIRDTLKENKIREVSDLKELERSPDSWRRMKDSGREGMSRREMMDLHQTRPALARYDNIIRPAQFVEELPKGRQPLKSTNPAAPTAPRTPSPTAMSDSQRVADLDAQIEALRKQEKKGIFARLTGRGVDNSKQIDALKSQKNKLLETQKLIQLRAEASRKLPAAKQKIAGRKFDEAEINQIDTGSRSKNADGTYGDGSSRNDQIKDYYRQWNELIDLGVPQEYRARGFEHHGNKFPGIQSLGGDIQEASGTYTQTLLLNSDSSLISKNLREANNSFLPINETRLTGLRSANTQKFNLPEGQRQRGFALETYPDGRRIMTVYGKDSGGREGAHLYRIPYEEAEKLGLREKLIKQGYTETEEAIYKNKGGIVYASNGAFINAQPRGTDTVPAMLTPGEFVINRQAAQQHMPMLQAINSGAYSQGGVVKYLAEGGMVSPSYYKEGGLASGIGNIMAAFGGMDMSAIQALASSLADLKDTFGSLENIKSLGDSLQVAVNTMGTNINSFGEQISSIPSQVLHNVSASVTQHITGLGDAGRDILAQATSNANVISRNATSTIERNRFKSEEGQGGHPDSIMGSVQNIG
jgi:hypothetical protein